MNLLARKLVELGDQDLKASDFWEKYKSEEDFVNEMLGRVPREGECGDSSSLSQIPRGVQAHRNSGISSKKAMSP